MNTFDAMARQLTAPGKAKEIQAGDVFTRLTATGEWKRDKWQGRVYECACICGVVGYYRKTMLLNGSTKSCGCWRVDHIRSLQPLAIAAKRKQPTTRCVVSGQFIKGRS